jgi:hypothetical protein
MYVCVRGSADGLGQLQPDPFLNPHLIFKTTKNVSNSPLIRGLTDEAASFSLLRLSAVGGPFPHPHPAKEPTDRSPARQRSFPALPMKRERKFVPVDPAAPRPTATSEEACDDPPAAASEGLGGAPSRARARGGQ